MSTEIKHENPPIFEKAAKLFGVTEDDTIFYSWGDTIYTPTGKMPSDDLLVHEGTHAEQQGHSPEGAQEWWDHYFADPAWRVQQEAEAFGEQLRFIERRQHDRNAIARIVNQMASSLSSKMYGSVVTYADATRMIRAYASGNALEGIEDRMGGDNEPNI